jgi:hypothetical protein
VCGGRSTATVDLARPGFSGFFIKTPGHYWVWGSVEAAGDQNGDGLAVVVVGPAGGNPVYVVFGKRDNAAVDTAHLGHRGFTLAPTVGLAWQAGDINGDKRTDLLAFGDLTFKGRQNAGGAFVLFGRRPPVGADMMKLGSRGLTIGGRIGEQGCEPAPDANIVDCAVENEGLGRGTSLGDLNGDRFGDLALGARRANRIYVIHGRARAATVDLAALRGRDYVITGSPGFSMSDTIAWVGGPTLAVLGSGRHGQEVRLLTLRG